MWLRIVIVLWPPHAKSWLIGKDSDDGSGWGQEEKGTTEDEMAGWHHWLDGREFEWTLGVGDGQGGLACCDSWGCKESDTTEWLNWRIVKSHKLLRTEFYTPAVTTSNRANLSSLALFALENGRGVRSNYKSHLPKPCCSTLKCKFRAVIIEYWQMMTGNGITNPDSPQT